MSATATPEVLDSRLSELGEGPMWDARTGEIFWVDILNGAAHALAPATGAARTLRPSRLVGAILPRREPGEGWLVSLEHGPALLGEDGEPEPLGTWAEADGAEPEVAVRCNDAKCDPRGRCLLGTMAHGADPGCGSLYRLEPGAPLERVLAGVTISNGLAWTDDARTLYYVDTGTQRIDAFDYDLDTGALANRRPVVEVPKEAGMPDGMTIDAEGCLWLALWGGGAVRRYTPDGRLDRVVELPTPQVTSCVFAGPKLDLLVITTARLGLGPEETTAGLTFVLEPGVSGTPTLPYGG
ncbi:MAG TPA: SMP-30/gluconolactonase/LRE family protein [Gaiellaceae bacterium]|nr:SMP-30/gluconolactonase/LRE family protein [Gaiellaceae bacterium]